MSISAALVEWTERCMLTVVCTLNCADLDTQRIVWRGACMAMQDPEVKIGRLILKSSRSKSGFLRKSQNDIRVYDLNAAGTWPVATGWLNSQVIKLIVLHTQCFPCLVCSVTLFLVKWNRRSDDFMLTDLVMNRSSRLLSGVTINVDLRIAAVAALTPETLATKNLDGFQQSVT